MCKKSKVQFISTPLLRVSDYFYCFVIHSQVSETFGYSLGSIQTFKVDKPSIYTSIL